MTMKALAPGETPYDLILLDEHFGFDQMKGIAATVAMRAAGVSALIVGFTGDSHPEHDARACAAGQDHVIGKPFTDAKELRHVLQRLVRTRAAATVGGGGDRTAGGNSVARNVTPPLRGLGCA